MSDINPVEPKKVIEQENSPAPTSAELAESGSASGRSRRGMVSLIFGIASIVLAPLILLSSPVAWVGYLGLVATLIALLAGRGELRARGEIDRRGRKLAQVGVATGILGFLAVVALFVLQSAQAVQQSTALLATAKAPPKTFESADFTFTYPGGWQAADTSQKAECSDPAFECLIWLDAPLGDGRLVILRSPDPGVETAEEFDQAFWAGAEAKYSGVELVSKEDIQVDQHPAIQRIFHRLAPDDPGRRVYMLVVTTASDGVIYQFVGAAGDSDAFDGHRATFENITQSVDFKEPSVAQATLSPKVYEGENFTLTYPRHWSQSGTTSGCADCPVLVHTYRDGSNITFILDHFRVPDETVEEADASWWKAATDLSRDVVLESRQTIEVDRRPAIKRIYHEPGSDEYSISVVLLDGGDAYVLKGSAHGQEAFDEHQAEIERITDSLRFKYPPQIATVTPARPTARPTSAPENTPVAFAGQVFEGDGFTLAYPDGWVSVDVDLAPICQEVVAPAVCALVITSPDDETMLTLQHVETASNVTAEQLDTAIWAMMEENDPSLELESREEIEMDRQLAIRRVARMADPGSPTGQAYLLMVVTVKDSVFYQFIGMSTSAEALKKALSDVEDILDSWRFAP